MTILHTSVFLQRYSLLYLYYNANQCAFVMVGTKAEMPGHGSATTKAMSSMDSGFRIGRGSISNSL